MGLIKKALVRGTLAATGAVAWSELIDYNVKAWVDLHRIKAHGASLIEFLN
jgi:hypothetical protein